MYAQEKQKRQLSSINGYGLVLAGFLLGVVVVVVIGALANTPTSTGGSRYENPRQAELYQTATAIMGENAGLIENPVAGELEASATALILQATQQAPSGVQQDEVMPLYLTATAVIIQATQQAP